MTSGLETEWAYARDNKEGSKY